MKQIKIGQKEIGEGRPCFIIAEAGVNHNGKLAIAKKLVDAAAEAEADAVKFQAFKSKDLVTGEDSMAQYQQQNIGKQESQQEMLKKLELKPEKFAELKRYCDKKAIMFLVTPHTSGKTLDLVNKLVPAFKLGSGDLTNHGFLAEVAKKGKPIFLSTGMSTMQEAKEALQAIYNAGNNKVVMLHCTSSYPCALQDVNLRAMVSMKEELKCLIGYSDHSQSQTVPLMACVLGACIVEKHFTLDKNMQGPDHKASLEPTEFKKMIEGIRKIEKKFGGKTLKPEELRQVIENTEEINLALGSHQKRPTKAEKDIAKHARKSLIASRDIKKGAKVTMAMICVKRPGTGISPTELEKIVGKKAKRKIKKNEVIKWSYLR